MSDTDCQDDPDADITVWRVNAEPINGNTEGTVDHKNEGGVVIALTDGLVSREVSRIAYKRRHGSERRRFKDQFLFEVATAQEAADVMNDLQRRARDAVREARILEASAQEEAERAHYARLDADRRANRLVREARELLDQAAEAHEQSASLR